MPAPASGSSRRWPWRTTARPIASPPRDHAPREQRRRRLRPPRRRDGPGRDRRRRERCSRPPPTRRAPSASAAVLALRRLGRPEVAAFLADADPKVATEAAWRSTRPRSRPRCPPWRTWPSKPGLTEPLAPAGDQRGEPGRPPEDAAALAGRRSRDDASKNGRVEALSILGRWAKPPGRDRINGLWRPVDVRPARPPPTPSSPVVGSILKDAPDDVRLALPQGGRRAQDPRGGPRPRRHDRQQRGSNAARAEAIKTLEKLDDPRSPRRSAWRSGRRTARSAPKGSGSSPSSSPERAIPALAPGVEVGTTTEKQKALEILAPPTAPRRTPSWPRPRPPGRQARPGDRARTA